MCAKHEGASVGDTAHPRRGVDALPRPLVPRSRGLWWLLAVFAQVQGLVAV
jgi:hypothetical protein